MAWWTFTIRGLPIGKPRMTQSDKWKKRAATDKYWGWVNSIKQQKPQNLTAFPKTITIKFYMPMPQNWSKKKKDLFNGTLHFAKPDVDNLAKGVLDALFEKDQRIGKLNAEAVWINGDGYAEIMVENWENEMIEMFKSDEEIALKKKLKTKIASRYLTRK